jgi:hypothetical protein
MKHILPHFPGVVLNARSVRIESIFPGGRRVNFAMMIRAGICRNDAIAL